MFTEDDRHSNGPLSLKSNPSNKMGAKMRWEQSEKGHSVNYSTYYKLSHASFTFLTSISQETANFKMINNIRLSIDRTDDSLWKSHGSSHLEHSDILKSRRSQLRRHHHTERQQVSR